MQPTPGPPLTKKEKQAPDRRYYDYDDDDDDDDDDENVRSHLSIC
jgi:hypothetical protein